MNEEIFVVALAGRNWNLPHLPFRVVNAVQPVLFQVYLDAGAGAASDASIARLGEAQLEKLAEAVWRAVAHVEPGLCFEEFLALPFSVSELILAFPAVARAVGLKSSENGDEAARAGDGPPGKSTSTP